MKILLTNINLKRPHGSENWMLTVANALKCMGHEITFFTAGLGWFSLYLIDAGYRIAGIEEIQQTHYDLAVINHSRALMPFISRSTIDRMIFVIHGRSGDEQPVYQYDGSCKYVAVSQEVRDHWQPSILNHQIQVVPNPVDELYFDAPALSSLPLDHVLWGNHRFRLPASLESALKAKRINCEILTTDLPPESIHAITINNQMTIGTGRWIYQAMAAGRVCLIADSDKTCGYLTADNYEQLIIRNMTTRFDGAKVIAVEPEWKRILNDYEPRIVDDLKTIAWEKHRSEAVVKELLNV